MPSAVINKSEGTFVIPAAHTDRLQAILAGRQAAPVPLARVIQQVFSADYSAVYNVPAPMIKKLATSEKATRLVLCANYDAAGDCCPCGDRCKFVHADVRTSTKSIVHNNYAWPSLESVTYERFDAGTTLDVAAPSTKNVVDTLRSEQVLKTKALESTRRPLSHCAHYYLNRTCNLGPDCQFIHAVVVDPDAKPHQRAPAPAKSATTTPNACGAAAPAARATPVARKDRSPLSVSCDSSALFGTSATALPAAMMQSTTSCHHDHADDLRTPVETTMTPAFTTTLHREWTDLSVGTPLSRSETPVVDVESSYVPAEGASFDPLVAVMLYKPRSACVSGSTTPSASRRLSSPSSGYVPLLGMSLASCPESPSTTPRAAAKNASTYGYAY